MQRYHILEALGLTLDVLSVAILLVSAFTSNIWNLRDRIDDNRCTHCASGGLASGGLASGALASGRLASVVRAVLGLLRVIDSCSRFICVVGLRVPL